MSRLLELAWKLHHENGHPDGYDGPCWGPTMKEVEQVREQLSCARQELKIRRARYG
jgi:hypothetical protein